MGRHGRCGPGGACLDRRFRRGCRRHRADRPDAWGRPARCRRRQVLRPAILWNDQRTARECDAIRAAVGPERLIEITGNDALTGFTAPKSGGVRDHEPEIWGRIAHVLLPKDFVRLRLTGEYALDKADGAGTILFDLAPRLVGRDSGVLRRDRSWMAAAWTFEGPVADWVTRWLLRRRSDCGGRARQSFAGRLHQAANAVGVGAVAPGVVALSLGTSGVIFATTEEHAARLHGCGVHAFCHGVPDRWHLMTACCRSPQPSLVPHTWRRVRSSARWPRRPARSWPAATVSGSCCTRPVNEVPMPTCWPAGRSFADKNHDRRHLTRSVLGGRGIRAPRWIGPDAGDRDARLSQVRARAAARPARSGARSWPTVLRAEIATVDTTGGGVPTGPALLAAVGAIGILTVEAATAVLVRCDPGRRTGCGRRALRRRVRDLPGAVSGTCPELPPDVRPGETRAEPRGRKRQIWPPKSRARSRSLRRRRPTPRAHRRHREVRGIRGTRDSVAAMTARSRPTMDAPSSWRGQRAPE